MSEHRPPLEPDYTLNEVVTALGMSERWIRQQIKEGAEFTRYGHKIRFSAAQVEKLRAQFVQNAEPVAKKSITTGRRRRAS